MEKWDEGREERKRIKAIKDKREAEAEAQKKEKEYNNRPFIIDSDSWWFDH